MLGAGGSKGFAHIGFLKAIEELAVHVTMVTGVSIGSLIAALYTAGIEPSQMERILLEEIRRLSPGRLLRGNFDLPPHYASIVKRYGLRPDGRLRIVATEWGLFQRRPVTFEGTGYDLALALSASSAVPFVMKPVRCHRHDGTTHEETHHRTMTLVDGGIYHPCPTQFCRERAIASRLGPATRPSQYNLCLADRIFHAIERFGARYMRYGAQPDGHTTILTGQPHVATMSFGLSDKQYRDMIDYGYRQTMAALAPACAGKSGHT